LHCYIECSETNEGETVASGDVGESATGAHDSLMALLMDVTNPDGDAGDEVPQIDAETRAKNEVCCESNV
jgi:hypothetical protein